MENELTKKISSNFWNMDMDSKDALSNVLAWRMEDSKHIDVWDYLAMLPMILERFKLIKVDDLSFIDLIFIYCHIILLHSGFVCTGVLSVTASTLSLSYTLFLKVTKDKYLTENDSLCDSLVKENVLLKFKSLDHFTFVYGSLSDGKSEVYRLCFDKYRHAPIFTSDFELEHPRENEDFQLLRMIREGLVLPLINDLCGKAGVKPPTQFMVLPDECIIKILEHLPVVDIIKMVGLSKELKRCSSAETIRNKFVEEIPKIGTGAPSIDLSSCIHPKHD